jgi:hypothetical protein
MTVSSLSVESVCGGLVFHVSFVECVGGFSVEVVDRAMGSSSYFKNCTPEKVNNILKYHTDSFSTDSYNIVNLFVQFYQQ